MLIRVGRLALQLLAICYGVGLIALTTVYFRNYDGAWLRKVAERIPLRERGCGPCGACNRCFENGGEHVKVLASRVDQLGHRVLVAPGGGSTPNSN